MSGKISKAESWSTVYKAYQNVNFSAFDYETVKRSLIDYIKTYHPENFNDYIENSEVIALIELFAYVAQLLAYRQDMNAHENFIGLAQRKQSILQLAKYISYKTNRNLAPRGLVKITSVQTTEEVYDTKGNNLANRKVVWNDTNNLNWKEQFFAVIARIMEQRYGSVSPNDRVQVDDVVFELYRLTNKPLQRGVLTYTATSNGQSYNMELVPAALGADGPYERRPAKNSTFSILYGSDGLGDASDTTGFFMFTKQGVLNKITRTFDGITPNQTITVNVSNINDTDVWVNNIDPDTGLTDITVVFDALGRRRANAGEWSQVDATNVENIIYNTNVNRNKFEVETLENDAIRVTFGDGEFADIPAGTFDIWYRTSNAGDSIILRNSVIDQTTSLTYVDPQQKIQTITFTFSLVNSLTNGAASEDIERVRAFAPSIYYTQDRMVNGRDYNSYMLQNQSIAKLRAINRTFAGESKYLAWHDPSEYYENVKLFGDDLSLYYTTSVDHTTAYNTQLLNLVRNSIQPLLTNIGVHLSHVIRHLPVPIREFTEEEMGTASVTSVNTILGELQLGLNNPGDFNVFLCYRPVYSGSSPSPLKYKWVAFGDAAAELESGVPDEATITIRYIRSESLWRIEYLRTTQVAYSSTTKFWFNNGDDRVLVDDTLNSKLDDVVLLKANVTAAGKLLPSNLKASVIGSVFTTEFPDAALQNEQALSVTSPDSNGDGSPDDLAFSALLRETWTATASVSSSYPQTITIEFPADKFLDATPRASNLQVVVNGQVFVDAQLALTDEPQSLYTYTTYNAQGEAATGTEQIRSIRITLASISETTTARKQYNAFIARGPLNVTIHKVSHAYFALEDGAWTPATSENLALYELEWYNQRAWPTADKTVARFYGMNQLNFGWFHRTPRYNIIDPSVTNIIDMFILTRGYYNEVLAWANGDRSSQPSPPTPQALRTTFADILEARMISDAVVLHPGKFKVLFGPKAPTTLRASFKLIKSKYGTLSDNELKVAVVGTVRSFFSVDQWEFGETFYFSELSAAIHANLAGEIDSVVLVPEATGSAFGDMFEVTAQEDELFIPDISVNNVALVTHLTQSTLNQTGV